MSRRSRLVVLATSCAVAVAAIVVLIVAFTAGSGPPAPAAAAAVPVAVPESAPAPIATTPSTVTTPPAAAAAPANASSRSVPVRLVIPAIGVSTSIIEVGVNADHTLQVPPLDATGTHEVGWYDLGPAPGQIGPAVIVGHVDSTSGPAVFFRLGTLVAGDRVMVTRADHSTDTFTVTAVAQYPKTGFPTEEVYGPVHQPDLRLITCGGAFDHATGHYLSNTVVYATAS